MIKRARPMAALVGVVAVIALLVIATDSGGPAVTGPGSRAAGKAGTLALYTWLNRLGFSTTRLSGTFNLSTTDVLVINEPTAGFSGDDTRAIRSFLGGGGEVILASDDAGTRITAPLMARLGVATPLTAHGPGTSRAVQPLNERGDAQNVPLGDGPAFAGTADIAPLLALGTTIVTAAASGSGAGRLFIIGSSLPLSNDGLRKPDSAALVLALLERARGPRVAFDEFHHGETHEPGASDILVGPVGLAGLMFCVVVLLYLGLSGRRLGRPIPAGDPGRVPSASEYIDAMGALIERSRLRGGVADRYADELKRRVAAVTGGDARLSDAEFVASLRGYPPGQTAAVAAALGRGRDLAASHPGEQALVQLAQHIDALERVWDGTVT